MAKTLTKAIRDLPPELFNQIRSTVLACACGRNEHNPGDPHGIHITAEYEFPKKLHINTFTRKDFAKHYYTNTILVFTSWEIFQKYMTVVSEAHLALIAGIHLIHGDVPRAPKLNALWQTVLLNKNLVKWGKVRWRYTQKAICAGIYFTCEEEFFVHGIDVILTFAQKETL